MVSQDVTDEDSPDSLEATTDSADRARLKRRSASRVALWLTGPLVLVALLVLAFIIYLSSAGIDLAYAIGASGWAAPPGTTLARRDIGGKSPDQVEGLIDQLSTDFGNLSVWLAETSLISVADNEFTPSTALDEVAVSVSPTEIGLSLDVHSMRSEIADLGETSADPWSVPHRLRLWREPPVIPVRLSVDEEAAREFLNGTKSKVDREPVDASLDLANFRISPSRDGLKIDVDATVAKIPRTLEALDDLAVELVLDRVPPRITEDAFSGIDVKNPLADYTTRFPMYKRNRSFNIELIASRFEGVVIEPGEVLSFNGTTGPRTAKEGYLLAPMYENRRIIQSPAGGACQVSTTLFNAALLAGLEIVERSPHSRPCSYVPYGRDATVAYGSVDLKFRNTLKHAIIIHQEVDRHKAGTIRFAIFGHPDDRVNVKITNAYSWVGRTESMDTYVVDTSLAPGSRVVDDDGVNGIFQRAWRTWYDSAGNEVRTEEISSDHIRPIGALIRYNPGPDGESGIGTGENPAPADEPSEEPSPDQPPEGIF